MYAKHVPGKANAVWNALSHRPDLALVRVEWHESDGVLYYIREAQEVASSDPEWQKSLEYAK